jgi:hypothetical protein
MHMRTLILIAAGVVGACAPAAAQTAPAAPGASPGVVRVLRVPSAMRVESAAFSLNGAYREIGRAEQAGATGHLVEAARTHYRGAMARYGKNDGTGAAAEARLATDLARAALDERPAPVMPTPRDLPAPPAMPSMPGRPGMPGMSGMPGMPGMPGIARGGPPGGGPGGFGGGGFRMHGSHGFDAMSLAEAMKIDSSPEAKQLAQTAVDANAAAQRAALAGNVAEAARQTRLSADLMSAVNALVALNHPELHRSTGTRIEIQREMRPPPGQ